jgi:hypothetical protein
LAAPEDRAEAASAYELDVYAASTRRVFLVKAETVERALAKWGYDMLPPTCEKVAALGATLKAGGYLSASSYLSAYRGIIERAGFQLDGPLARSFKDSVRSCERGQGGPTRTLALRLESLDGLPAEEAPWSTGGPANPRNAIVCGSWFMTREIELSTARAALVQIVDRESSPRAVWHLPASKTDPQAFGVSRTHGCSCSGAPGPNCPAHELWDKLLFLRRRFPGRWTSEGPDWDLPLFPTPSGAVVEKEAMAATIRQAALRLGQPLSPRISRSGCRGTVCGLRGRRGSHVPALTPGRFSSWAGGAPTPSAFTFARLRWIVPQPGPRRRSVRCKPLRRPQPRLRCPLRCRRRKPS